MLAGYRKTGLSSVDTMTKNIPKMPKPGVSDVEGFASAYAPGTIIATHAHAAHQIVHAISGAMRVAVKGSMWFLPPGRALWVPANVSHAIRCAGRVEMRTIYLSDTHATSYPDVRVVSVSPLMREIIVRLAEGCSPRQLSLLKDLLIDEIRTVEAEALRLPIPGEARIATLAASLQSNPEDHTTLESWARRLGFSQRNLIRSIRRETGMSFRELRRQARVFVAIEKLSEGQSVTSVAFDVGFETPSAFIHAFRAVTGKTPRKYIS